MAQTKVATTQVQNPVKFRAYRSTAQSVTANTPTKIQFNSENFDTGSNLDTTTNVGRFTAPVDGFYWFGAAWQASVNGTTQMGLYFYKNGASYSIGQFFATTAAASATNTEICGSDLIQLAAGEYVEVYAFCNGAVPIVTGSTNSYFSGFLVSQT